MKAFLNTVFSMRLMAAALFVFFIAIGYATFVENDFGTPVAQKQIYKATWFTWLLGYLTCTLIFSIYKYKLIPQKKFSSIIFHVALIVIIIGAWITRNYGFEGIMTIREGSSSNYIISTDTYIQIKVHDYKIQHPAEIPILLDTNVYELKENGKPDYSENYFEHSFNFPGKEQEIKISFNDLIPNVKDTLIPDLGGKKYIDLVTGGMTHNYIESGKIMRDGFVKVAFNNFTDSTAIIIFDTDTGLFVQSPVDLSYFQMSDMSTGIITADSIQAIHTKRAYTIEQFTFVFYQYYPSAFLTYQSSLSEKTDIHGLLIDIYNGKEQKQIMVKGGKGSFPRPTVIEMDGLTYEIAYGSKIIELPFSVYLRDFQLERYPGGESPSSFASEVTVIDKAAGKEFDHRIFMNNVLDYGGYRFFQSNYDSDEMGTILSVNHDGPGTMTTYIGYLLLGLGFVLNLLSKKSRFAYLIKKSKELKELQSKAILMLLFFGLFYANNSQATITRVVDAEHAEKFGELVIQDNKGRFKPVHTLALELLRKIHRSDTYKDYTAMQVYLGILTNFEEWNLEPIILIPGYRHSDFITSKLNLPDKTKYACIQDFITTDGTYILIDDVKKAHAKPDGKRDQYDKDLLKIDERFNVAVGLFYGFYFKIFPIPNDPSHKWTSPFDAHEVLDSTDANFVENITKAYFMGIEKGYKLKNWDEANLAIDAIKFYQTRIETSPDFPSESKIKLEITYNKLNLFKRLNIAYFFLGFILLTVQILRLFFNKNNFAKTIMKIGFWLLLFCFIVHGIGLGLRWYLSGHAPWSNGYEAVVFIGFITVLAGLIFSRQNQIILGATGILAWLMLFVAHMNELDPEITNLVPVLKSYWLMIHVAIITGSYGFLGLSAILALVNLCLYIFMNSKTKSNLMLHTRQLTYILEMSMIIGLFMLTIGTFLGGVWANESWGRYWGWDAKETWALASVLVYAIILHLRFIPGLQSNFVLNTWGLWGYASIIMTFFGVNFYLSGLHSYAQGDPIPIPMWVPISVVILIVINLISYYRYTRITRADA